MATKSILKNVTVRDKKTCSSLVNALENAKEKKSKDVILSRSLRRADRKLVLKLFRRRKCTK